MTKVKICGVRTIDNALMVAREGADLLGLNFYRESPRYIELEAAGALVRHLKARLGACCPVMVGVFVNATPDEIRAIVSKVGLDYAQLSGDESLDDLVALRGIAFRGIRPKDVHEASEAASRFGKIGMPGDDGPTLLVDAFNPKLYGGTGEVTSVEIALAAKSATARLMLAGGLNPGNVEERARQVRPWAVDVASGVEDGRPGIKDEGKVRAFIAAVRSADA